MLQRAQTLPHALTSPTMETFVLELPVIGVTLYAILHLTSFVQHYVCGICFCRQQFLFMPRVVTLRDSTPAYFLSYP